MDDFKLGKRQFQNFYFKIYVKLGIPVFSIGSGIVRLIGLKKTKSPNTQTRISHYYNLMFVPGYKEDYLDKTIEINIIEKLICK